MRTKLRVVVTVPVVIVVVLTGLRMHSQLQEQASLSTALQGLQVGTTALQVADALQNERAGMVAHVASLRADSRALGELIDQTDRAAFALRSASTRPDLAADVRANAQRVLNELAGLPALRATVQQTRYPAIAVLGRYTQILDRVSQLNRVTTGAVSNLPVGRRAQAMQALVDMQEQMTFQNALLRDAAIAQALPPESADDLQSARSRFDAARAVFTTSADAGLRQRFEDTVSGPDIDGRNRLVDKALVASAAGLDVNMQADEVSRVGDAAAGLMRVARQDVERQVVSAVDTLAAEARHSLLRDQALVAVCLAVAVAVMVWMTRLLTRPLRTLRRAALMAAASGLPEAVKRILADPDPDAQAHIDPVPVHTSEEIGQVARAFDIVLDQAARLAAGQARLRGLLKATITNLSRRSQALVERQISVIDQLEQDEGDPEQLAILFALDHLATRMRRNNENLLVLSDTPLRQRTSTPAPIAEVVGAAISEIDKYKRVRVNELPDVAVYPHAVSNLIHLIAELLDNATEFSAPDTEVTVDGRLDRTSGHLSLLIRDRGLGLDAERLEKFNTNLATPPELDASVSQQMGLFVVAKLAARNGIHVELRVDQELDAGTSALVVIPGALLQVSAAARTSVDQAPHVTSDSATDGGSASRVDLFDPETIDPTPPDDTHTYRTWTPSSAEGAREAEHSGTAAATDIGAQTERFAPIRVAVSQWFQSTTEEESGQGGGGTVPEQQPTQSRQGAPVAATGPHPQHHTAVLPRQASDATRLPRWEPIDAGWRAAHEVSTRRATAAASTTTGLPKRQPHNDLLPGAMTAPPSDDRGGAQRPTRSAAARREGLTGLQQGISLARQYPQSATTGSQPQWHPPPRPAASQEQA